MSTAMSSPNVELVPSLAHTPSHTQDGHVVQLYAEDGFLIDVLSRFVGGALAVGDAAVVIATRSHRTELERRLSANGVDTDKAALQGRYIVLDAIETLPQGDGGRPGRRGLAFARSWVELWLRPKARLPVSRAASQCLVS